MQSGELKEEYNKKLDELIEFFKIKKDKDAQQINFLKEESRFSSTGLMSAFTIFVAISIAVFNFDRFIGLLGFIIFVIILSVYVYMDNKITTRLNENYINKIIRYDQVIEFLQYLKVSQTEVDLSSLVTKIRQCFKDNRVFYMKNYDEIWIGEVIDIIDIINNEIIGHNPKIQ
jgi:hypothetical protein